MTPFRVAENWRILEKKRALLDKTGKIVSYTRVYSGPARKENRAPYYMACIEMENGIKEVMEIVDAEKEKIKKGMQVKTCLRRIAVQGTTGLINYGIKCRVIK